MTVPLIVEIIYLAFLRNHFEVLHTQGDAYILEEIELFLKNRKQK